MARAMKDSGVAWIGEIPEEWSVLPAQRGFSEVKRKNSDGAVQKALQFKFGVIIPKTNFDADDDYVADTILTYTVVEPGTVMINGLNLNYDFKTQRTGLVKEKGVITSAYLALWPNPRLIIPEYATYLFKGYETRMALHNMGAGIRLTLGYKEFKKQPVLFPSLPEQSRIAEFLDRRCAEIDSVIATTQRTIEEYKNLKQSIITEAVTHGVRGPRKMKDSGVEWIGEIPEEWKIGKAKYYVIISNGSDPQTDGDIPVYGSGASSFKTCGEFKEGPTVLIGRKGATLHIPHYIEGKYWNVDTAFDVKTLKGFSLRFYYYLACCFDYKFFISQTTLPGMTQTNYENMIVPVPDLDEQNEIVCYLDSRCTGVDNMIDAKQQLLTQLEAYKKSVIYEYVTGKKEV